MIRLTLSIDGHRFRVTNDAHPTMDERYECLETMMYMLKKAFPSITPAKEDEAAGAMRWSFGDSAFGDNAQ